MEVYSHLAYVVVNFVSLFIDQAFGHQMLSTHHIIYYIVLPVLTGITCAISVAAVICITTVKHKARTHYQQDNHYTVNLVEV